MSGVAMGEASFLATLATLASPGGRTVETFGEAARRLRGSLSVRAAARLAHMDPGHLSRIERSKRRPTITVAQALDDAYAAGGELVALVAGVRDEPWELDGGIWRPKDSERLAAAIIGERVTATNAVELAHQWLIAEPPQVTATRAGRRIGVAQVAEVEARVHQLRR